jgi:hypothetical protein
MPSRTARVVLTSVGVLVLLVAAAHVALRARDAGGERIAAGGASDALAAVPPAESVSDDRAPPGRPPRARAAPTQSPRGVPEEPERPPADDAAPSPPPELSDRTTGAVSVARLPSVSVPDDAVVLDESSDLRAWAVLDRRPVGLEDEPGATAGRVRVQLSRAAPRDVVLDLRSDPDGALRLPGGGHVRIPAGRGFAMVTVLGVRSGPAAVVLSAAGASGTHPAQFRVAVEVGRTHDAAEPRLVVVAADPGPEAPGALLAGGRRVSGLAGTVAGALRVGRTGFRGLATTATEIVLCAEDPAGVLGPVPAIVTIPAGALEAETTVPIVLRDAEGRALLRFRAGAQEATVAIDAVRARWDAVPPLVVPVGGRLRHALRLAPATRVAPECRTAVEPAASARAAVGPDGAAPWNEQFVLDVTGVASGAAQIRIEAPDRARLDVALTVVPREVEVRGERAVVLRPVAGAGTLVLSLPPEARWVADGVRAGVRVDGIGSAEVTVRVDTVGTAAELVLPLRIAGTASAVRVRDGTRETPRLPYEVHIDGPAPGTQR